MMMKGLKMGGTFKEPLSARGGGSKSPKAYIKPGQKEQMSATAGPRSSRIGFGLTKKKDADKK